MILVVGGTGQLGAKVAETLLAEGTRVRIMTRTPANATRLAGRGAEVVAGDLRDPDSVRRAFDGVERVVACAHALSGKGRNDPRSVDDAGYRHLIEAARKARVSHVVFVSALGAAAQHPIAFYRIKHATEARLRASGLSHTILRPAAFMETWAAPIGDPVIARGRATIVGPGRNPINLMAVDDVAHYAMVGLFHPGARNRVIEIGGPENLTALEVVAAFERATGRRARRSHVPLALLRMTSTLVRPFDGATRRRLEVAIHQATSDQTFDPAPTLAEFPFRLTRLAEFAQRRSRATQEASHVSDHPSDASQAAGAAHTQRS